MSWFKETLIQYDGGRELGIMTEDDSFTLTWSIDDEMQSKMTLPMEAAYTLAEIMQEIAVLDSMHESDWSLH